LQQASATTTQPASPQIFDSELKWFDFNGTALHGTYLALKGFLMR